MFLPNIKNFQYYMMIKSHNANLVMHENQLNTNKVWLIGFFLYLPIRNNLLVSLILQTYIMVVFY